MLYRTLWAVEILPAAGGTKVFQFLWKGSNHIFHLVFLTTIVKYLSLILIPEVLLLILPDPAHPSGDRVFANG